MSDGIIESNKKVPYVYVVIERYSPDIRGIFWTKQEADECLKQMTDSGQAGEPLIEEITIGCRLD